MRINVQGGTKAGRKPPLKPRSGPWACECIDTLLLSHPTQPGPKRVNPGYLARCRDCGTVRP